MILVVKPTWDRDEENIFLHKMNVSRIGSLMRRVLTDRGRIRRSGPDIISFWLEISIFLKNVGYVSFL